MLAMAVIIIPLGTATIIMAIELGLFFEALSDSIREVNELLSKQIDG